MHKCWIPGLPATFATKGESFWKDELKTALQGFMVPETITGIEMQFVLPKINLSAHCPDVDNLCEPVFSVTVNNLGWFGGRRTNIKWWFASKTYGDQPGLKMVLHQEELSDINDKYGDPCTALTGPDNYYETMNLQKPPGKRMLKLQDRFMIRINFGSSKVNIGDIATGKVKGIIDSLFPFIGGTKGSPEDWRIQELQVRKGVPGVKDGAVEVNIWRQVFQ